MLEHLDGHRWLAAKLARQGPLRADAIAEDATKHARAGRRAGDFFHFGLAVDREETNAERKGTRDVAFLFDGVAIGDAVGRGAVRERHANPSDPRHAHA